MAVIASGIEHRVALTQSRSSARALPLHQLELLQKSLMASSARARDREPRRLEHEHTLEAIRARLARRAPHSYLRDWVYGGIDGAVTTFAVVSGVAGAELGSRVVLILGVANLIADGFSMAASNYAGTRAEHQQLEQAVAIERRHIEQEPDGERTEIREIFRRKGLDGDDLEAVVKRIISNRDLWVRTMVTEEYDLPSTIRSPWLAALSTFSAFALCGAVPLFPYVLGVAESFARHERIWFST